MWVETVSIQIFDRQWRVFAQRREGGEPRLIAAAEDYDVSGAPVLTQSPRPRLSEGLVWWDAPSKQPDGSYLPGILAAPLDGGKATLMLDLVAAASPVDGGVVALRIEKGAVTGNDDEEDQNPYRQAGLVLIDATGKPTELAGFAEDDEGPVSQLASDGDVVVVVTGADVLVIRTDGTPIVRLPVPPTSEQHRVQDLVVCVGKVVFTPYDDETGGDAVVIYDTVTGALKTIDAPGAYSSVYCSAERVAWTQLVDDRIVTTIAEW